MKFICSIFLPSIFFISNLTAQVYTDNAGLLDKVNFGVKFFGNHNCYSSDRFAKLAYTYGHPAKLDDKVFKTLSAKEQFIYATIYPESYRQICSTYASPDDLLANRKLSAMLPKAGEMGMSERQKNALMKNRDSAISYIAFCINKDKMIFISDLQNILMLNAWEVIPVLQKVSVQHTGTSSFVYTTCALLMKAKGYKPFLASQTYKALYATAELKTEIDLTPAVVLEMNSLTNDFYTWAKAHK